MVSPDIYVILWKWLGLIVLPLSNVSCEAIGICVFLVSGEGFLFRNTPFFIAHLGKEGIGIRRRVVYLCQAQYVGHWHCCAVKSLSAYNIYNLFVCAAGKRLFKGVEYLSAREKVFFARQDNVPAVW